MEVEDDEEDADDMSDDACGGDVDEVSEEG